MIKNEPLITRKQELPLKDNSTTLFLKVMISIAVFLFAVTLAGVLSINSMLNAWNNSILGSLTVQIMPVNNINQEKARLETLEQQKKAVDFLKKLPEAEQVSTLNDAQLQNLLQPWLGDGIDISELPTPRLIDVKLKKGAEIDFAKLAAKLAEVSPLASLDNHKLWLDKLVKFADGLKMLAMSILVLVIAITSGAIFYTTQTNLGLHKNIIEILQIIEKAKVLHLALFDADYPYIVPLHYGYEYKEGILIFYMHCAKEGHKLNLIRSNPNVCIEVESDVELISGGDVACKYGASFASVIGRAVQN